MSLPICNVEFIGLGKNIDGEEFVILNLFLRKDKALELSSTYDENSATSPSAAASREVARPIAELLSNSVIE
jgi:hypothetical protein